MKVAIIAGGQGLRLREETEEKPKALVEIGGRPLLWHIMMHYAHHGFRDFVIALGYKGEMIRRCLAEGALPASAEAVDTGLETMNGGRIKRLAAHLGGGTFMLTWCDGVSDVNLRDLLAFHRSHGRIATLTAVHPPARFGQLTFEDGGNRIASFAEKPPASEEWINGAFFVLEPGVLDYIPGDDTEFEREPLERLARDGELMGYRHTSFWQCVDTIRDRAILEEHWRGGNPPWKVWA